MAVNRFDQPVQAQYISQYVPIPFEQLYKLGEQYNKQVDKNYQDLGTAITKFSDFQSPSAKDMQNWNKLTIEPAKQLVNEIAANPDLMKTPEGRARIQQFINSRPYGELSALKQSRDNMLKRQALNQQLAISGKYNPLWHDVDFTNYDTLSQSGVFNDLSPLAYKSEVDLVKPYVDNLKSSYLYTKGGYDYSGVSANTTDALVKENISAIYNTPEAQMHIRTLIKQGYTPEQAQDIFVNRIYRAGREFAYETREANPFSVLNEKHRLSGTKNNQTNGLFYLTQSIETTGLRNYLQNRANVLSNSKLYAKLYQDSKSKDENVRNAAEKEIQKLAMSTPQQIFRSIFDKHGSVDSTGKTKLNQNQLNSGVNEIMNNFSVPTQGGPLQELLSSTINGISTDTQTTPLGKRKIINGGQNMNLMSRIISGIAGFNPAEPENAKGSRNKILNNLKSGNFNNMILLSNGRILTIPSIKNGQPTTLNVQEVKVAIDDADLKRLGITEADMQKAGAKVIESTGSKTETTTLSGSYDEGEINYNKTSKSATNKPSKKYWELTLGNEIPTEGTSAEYLNQAALKQNIGSTGYTSEYPNVQNEAFNF